MLKWHHLVVYHPYENDQHLGRKWVVSQWQLDMRGRTTRRGAVLIRAACEESTTPKRMGRQMKFVSVSRWQTHLGLPWKYGVVLIRVTGWWCGTIFIFPYIGNNHPNWLSYFSEGLKPPIRSDTTLKGHLLGVLLCDPNGRLDRQKMWPKSRAGSDLSLRPVAAESKAESSWSENGQNARRIRIYPLVI